MPLMNIDIKIHSKISTNQIQKGRKRIFTMTKWDLSHILKANSVIFDYNALQFFLDFSFCFGYSILEELKTKHLF